MKIGNVELTDKEANQFYFDKKRYIVSYRRIYQLNWCENYKHGGGVYGTEIYYHKGDLPLTKKGRFFAMTAEQVNKLLRFDLLRV